MEGFSTSSVCHPHDDALDETKPAEGQVRDRFECPSPNRKRPIRACLAGNGRMGAGTNQRGKAIGSCSSVEEDGGGRVEDDSSRALIASYPVQEVVQEAAAIASGEIPFGWTRAKLEPDW